MRARDSGAASRAFLDRWHAFVATRDEALLPELLSDTVMLHAPVYWRPRQGRDQVAFLLGAVVRVFEGFAYRREWLAGHELALEFAATMGDLAVKGVDLISLDADGRIATIEVFLRPPNALERFRERMEAEVARRLAART